MSRNDRQKRDIIVRARLHTIEAKCAIEIAGFLGLKEIKLAAALFFVAANAIERPA